MENQENNNINETIESIKYKTADIRDLINRQNETIGRYESLLKKENVGSVYIRYAVFKSDKFMMKYDSGKTIWCIEPSEAHLFKERKMAEDYAKITHGKVVNITIGVSK